MNRATLEQLLIDRRMGELPGEVGELIDAYLAVQPSDAAVALEINALIKKSCAALQTSSPTNLPLPPFPAAKVEQALRTAFGAVSPVEQRTQRLQRLRPLAVAAALFLAFLLGTRTATTPDAVTPEPVQLAIGDLSSPAEVTTFWSVDRYVTPRSARIDPYRRNLEWTTPIAWPRLGEQQ